MNQHLLKKLDKIKTTAKLSKVLVVGGMGQLGRSFYPALCHIYGTENIVTCDTWDFAPVENYEHLDAIHLEDYRNLGLKVRPNLILHLPALLSGLLTSHLRVKTGPGAPSQQQQFPQRM
jgi:hypothetical protein